MLQRCGTHHRGLSFHVGSQSLTPETHVDAIRRCAELIAETERSTARPMNVLDIGGGVPVDYAHKGIDYNAYFKPIRDTLASAVADHIEIIAEPGRFLVAPAVAGIASVAGKARRGDYQWYYLDDGVYGSYSGQLFDHAVYPLQILHDAAQRQPSILAGPTCDSIDVIAEGIALPALQEGDLDRPHDGDLHLCDRNAVQFAVGRTDYYRLTTNSGGVADSLVKPAFGAGDSEM